MELNQEMLSLAAKMNPGLFAVYEIREGKLKTLFRAKGLAGLSGMTEEEYDVLTKEDAASVVMENDREMIAGIIAGLIGKEEDTDVEYRIRHKTLGSVWIHAKARIIGTADGCPVISVAYEDISDESREHAFLLGHATANIYVIDRNTHELLFANERAVKRNGNIPYSGKKCYDYICGVGIPCPQCPLTLLKNGYAHLDESYQPAKKRWYTIDCWAMNWHGREAAAIYAIDMTEERVLRKSLEIDKKSLEMTVNNIPVGVGVCEFKDGEIHTAAVNSTLTSLLGIENKNFSLLDAGLLERVHPDDRQMVSRSMHKSQIPDTTHTFDFRFLISPQEKHHWFRIIMRSLQLQDTCMIFSCILDISMEKETEQNLLRSRQIYEAAVEEAKLVTWEYDFATRRVTMAENEFTQYDYRKFGMQKITENAPDSLVPFIADEDREKFLEMYRAIRQGAPKASCEVWYKLKPGQQEPRCERICYTTVFDEGGKPVKAYGIGQNITARKMEEDKYANAYLQLAQAHPYTLGNFEFNLTRDTCENGKSEMPEFRNLLKEKTADGFFVSFASLIRDPGYNAAFSERFTRSALIESFKSGETKVSFDYPVTNKDGSLLWRNVILFMIQNPANGDVESTSYITDITERKKNEEVIRHLTSEKFDYIALLYLNDRTIEFRNKNESIAFGRIHEKENYEEWRAYMRTQLISPAEAESYNRGTELKTIRDELLRTGSYSFGFFMNEGEKTTRRQIQYSWLNREMGIVFLLRSDVTAAYQAEREQRQRLEVMLAAAKQASSAKSNFLSRMSHEIRTPMNAIIGMDTIAAQSIGNDEKTADCISKIGLSARYLLSLINEILDMSRIESGKMLLKNEPFLFRDFIVGINNMIFGQAQAKNLDYECIVSNDVEDSYVGDVMKLQQVLINILGNAVKFTDKGKISLDVSVVSKQEKLEKVRFVINDTGRGISEENRQRIFEPFEQADTSSTAVFGGTGLGLAITKSLVNLMGGKISLRSILGVGSEFTVEIPLTVDERIEKKAKCSIENLKNLHTLVVDDDLLICEETGVILKEIGMIGEWVTSGQEAVRRVQEHFTRQDFYDFILIDWKMPDMDGIETTRQIRKIVGPDVTIIIISAYDWEAIEAEARAAGANMLISKPIFKSSLISAFERAKGEASEVLSEKKEYDFTGKRILIAEDNQLNTEIARNLLESKKFTVETAPNGLKAMEMFLQNPVGYYDAILMDVRMPIMDGLQATVNIRHLNKTDGRTVPIIAMTANAFDEDVDKSRSAGMNAHLSKPIEPDLMFSTLNRLLNPDD